MSLPLMACAGFAAGAIAFHLASLPPEPPFWALIVAGGLLALRGRRWLVVASACIGLGWSAWHASQALDHRLEAPLETTVEAVVTDLVRHDEGSSRFVVRFDTPAQVRGARRARLTWYGGARRPAEGERWRLQVTLRPPSGQLNPGGFDRERWLMQRRVNAIGSVTEGHRIESAGPALDRARAALSRRLRAAVNHDQTGAMLAALAVGDRRFLDDSTWDVLLRTGTNHLVAISGLHVGLAGGLGMLFGAGSWRLAGRPTARVPAPVAGAVLGMVTATAYAALAGFTIPTQRALLMLAMVLAGIAARRPVRPLYLLTGAFAGVLFIDPLAPLAPGFWLSFAAVACLGVLVRGRAPGAELLRWPAIQVRLGLAIAPMTLGLFGHAALAAPAANLVAIPLVGFFAVPLTLLAAALAATIPELGVITAQWAAWVLWLFLALVTQLDALAGALPRPGVPESALAWLLLGACAALVLSPSGPTARVLAVPLVVAAVASPDQSGGLRATVLDVGYGHATVLEGNDQAVVVDSGRSGAEVNDLLALRSPAGADALVLTRDRAGYRGGEDAVHLAPQARRFESGAEAGGCREGDIEGTNEALRLRLLDRELGADGCILLAQTPAGRLLIATGLKPGESVAWSDAPRVDVVILPAAGHRDAVTAAMLDALQPDVAVIPVDSGNRYGLPHEETLRRLRQRDIRVYTTGGDGAVEVVIGETPRVRTQRQAGGWWNRRNATAPVPSR